MFVYNILLVLVFYLWISFLWSRRKYYMLSMKMHGPKGLPIIGVLHNFTSLEDLYLYASNKAKIYTSPVFSWLGPIPLIALYDPQTAQDILTSPHCVDRALVYGPMRDVLGNGLLTSTNPEWSMHRKLLKPVFSNGNIRRFLPIFNEKTKALLKDFEITYGGGDIDMLPVIKRLTMHTALQTTMGFKGDQSGHSNDGKEQKLFNLYHYFADKAMAMIIMPWLRLDVIHKFVPSFRTYSARKIELHKIFENEIHEKLSSQLPSNTELKNPEVTDVTLQEKKTQIFFDLTVDLMKRGKFTSKNVEDHANNLVFAAFETTATTITNALMFLAMNPQYQQIAFDEVSALYGDRDNVTVTDENLHHCVYLEMVINETMRLIPAVPVIGRKIASDVRLSSGVELPKGLEVYISIFHMHRDERIWGPNALVFDPENFLPENIRTKHPYAFIPFVKGIRNCIGWRYGMNVTKVVLAIFLRKYRFTTNSKFEDLRYEPAMSTRLLNQPLLQLHLRDR